MPSLPVNWAALIVRRARGRTYIRVQWLGTGRNPRPYWTDSGSGSERRKVLKRLARDLQK